jgi:pyocin large subunit-like protein
MERQMNRSHNLLRVLLFICGLIVLTFVYLGVRIAPETPVPGANIPVQESWGNLGTLEDHFNRHGNDFNAQNATDYANQASNFLKRSQTEGLPTKIGPDGTIRVYEPKSNTFGAYNPDGTTKTYFKPKNGIEYWNSQPGG